MILLIFNTIQYHSKKFTSSAKNHVKYQSRSPLVQWNAVIWIINTDIGSSIEKAGCSRLWLLCFKCVNCWKSVDFLDIFTPPKNAVTQVQNWWDDVKPPQPGQRSALLPKEPESSLWKIGSSYFTEARCTKFDSLIIHRKSDVFSYKTLSQTGSKHQNVGNFSDVNGKGKRFLHGFHHWHVPLQ